MATLDLSKPSSGLDMWDPDLGVFGSHYTDGTPTSWSYLTPGGQLVRLTGTGLTYDLAGRPTGGTVTSITIDAKNDSYPELVITGISVAAATLDDGPASFWRFLEGNDVILGPNSTQGAPNAIFRMLGDGVVARDGVTGGHDIIHIGDRIASVFGDVVTVGGTTKADYRGGNDEILGLQTSTVQYVYADAAQVHAGSRLTGGNDTVLIQSTSKDAAAAGDAAVASALYGSGATVVGGNDYMTAGYYFQGLLAGDVLYQEAGAIVQGGNDTINGGNLAEFISGDVESMKGSAGTTTRVVGGDDRIYGNAGDDVIAGDMRVMTAPHCTVVGGDDTIDGGAGNDVIAGDVYSAYPGVTSITGGADMIRGGAGNDQIYGDATDNNSNMVGVGGNDRLYGEDGDDQLFGHGGADSLDGGAGADTLWGGDGDDWLSGGAGNDRVYAGAGNDQVDGGAGDDLLYGMAGSDAYYVNSGGDSVLEDAGAGIDTVWASVAGYTLAANVEDLRYNGVGSFTGVGNGLANTIAGLSGNDRLEGGLGDDLLIGGAGADALVGGAGIDTASYAGAYEGVDARLLGGGYAGDALGDSYSGVEGLVGSGFSDVLYGDAQANTLVGGDGGDTIVGMDGGDLLRGGRAGDLLVGGRGADVFDFDTVGELAPGERDTITADINFGLVFEGAGVAGGDRIDLSGIDANGSAAGNQAFGFGGTGIGRVSLVDAGTNTIVRCNTDKDAAFELELTIEDGGILAVAYRAGDFVL